MCLTLHNNIGRVERLLDVFSTLRIFFVVKIHIMSYFYKNQNKTWPGRRPGIFFTVSEWGRRDPAEDHVTNWMSSGLQRHTMVINFKGFV